ncbi:MAG: pyridoxal-phosphate-dependent aminotransferase family protein [Anaerolineales bacterium]
MPQRKLMIPGPVDITDEVREAMAIPTMPHYGQEWIVLQGETREMAKQVFGTRHDLYILAGPGTMALEAALGSALEPGESVLVPNNGFFAARLIHILKGLNLVPVEVKAPMGQPVLAAEVAATLEAHPEVRVLALVHHETSTGVLNPLEEIAEVARDHELLTVVDAVSSLGGVPLPVDEWGIDFCVSVANKALETPPGLALLSISPRAWEQIEAREAPRGWYLDLKTWRWYEENWGDWHPSPVTMPTSNLYALHESLITLLEEGVERRYAEYRRAAQAVRRGLEALGFAMLTEDTYASPLTTAFLMCPGVEAEGLKCWLCDEEQIMISGGIGDLKGKILRVGHIGLARRKDYVIAFLLGVEDYLRSLGREVQRGAGLVALTESGF